MNDMTIKYEIKESNSFFWVGHTDINGEWWDADLDGFQTLEEAEKFRDEIQAEQDSQ